MDKGSSRLIMHCHDYFPLKGTFSPSQVTISFTVFFMLYSVSIGLFFFFFYKYAWAGLMEVV